MQEHVHQQLQIFQDSCRRAGLRLTPQRLEVYRQLASSKDHPSAEMLHSRLKEKMPTLSLDTVYRTLNTLAENRLINKVETIESQARFEVVQLLHHHLICEKCKQIMDFQWQLVDQASLPESVRGWGRVERKSVVAYGICKSCLKIS